MFSISVTVVARDRRSPLRWPLVAVDCRYGLLNSIAAVSRRFANLFGLVASPNRNDQPTVPTASIELLLCGYRFHTSHR